MCGCDTHLVFDLETCNYYYYCYYYCYYCYYYYYYYYCYYYNYCYNYYYFYVSNSLIAHILVQGLFVLPVTNVFFPEEALARATREGGAA